MMADKATPGQIREHQLNRRLYTQGIKDGELVNKILVCFISVMLGALLGAGLFL